MVSKEQRLAVWVSPCFATMMLYCLPVHTTENTLPGPKRMVRFCGSGSHCISSLPRERADVKARFGGRRLRSFHSFVDDSHNPILRKGCCRSPMNKTIGSEIIVMTWGGEKDTSRGGHYHGKWIQVYRLEKCRLMSWNNWAAKNKSQEGTLRRAGEVRTQGLAPTYSVPLLFLYFQISPNWALKHAPQRYKVDWLGSTKKLEIRF